MAQVKADDRRRRGARRADRRGAGPGQLPDLRRGEPVATPSRPTGTTSPTSVVVDPGSVHKAIVFGAALQEGVDHAGRRRAGRRRRSRKGDTTFTGHPPAADGHQDDAAGHPGLLVQRGHHHDRRPARRGEALRVPAAFGLGEPTGEGVPGEAPGWSSRRTNWSGVGYGSIPIGHERRVTPLQMAAVYAAIANDGV